MRRNLVSIAVVVYAWSGALAGEGVDRDEAVRALLARSRLLQDVHFTIPLDVYRQYLRDQKGGPSAPPVGAIAAAGRYRLSLDDAGKLALAASVEVRVLDGESCRNLPVLSAQWVWERPTVNDKPAELAVRKGWLCFTAPGAGVYTIAGRLPAQTISRDGGSLSVPVCRTVRTEAGFDSPAAWEVKVAGAAEILRGSAPGGTHGRIALAPTECLSVSIARRVELPPRPPRYELDGAITWNLDTGWQQVAASLRVGILGGRTDRLEASLPADARRVAITGPDVREAQVSGGSAVVFLRGAIAGQTRLSIAYERPDEAGSVQRLRPPDLANGHWSGGVLAITDTAGGREILAQSTHGLKDIAPADLPEAARALLAGRPVLAYEITSRDFTAAVDVVNLGELALRESIADLAHYQLLFRPDGSILCKVDYEVRNRNRQFLRLEVPGGADVLAARVNDKPCPITPLPGRTGVWLLPLVRSKASVAGLVSFPVQVLLLSRGPALGRAGEVVLPLPRIDLPIAYGWCEAYVPAGMKVRRWSGPMQPVDRYSSETAVASLTYGRGELAEGYKPEDRPEVTTTPQELPPERPARPGPRPQPVADLARAAQPPAQPAGQTWGYFSQPAEKGLLSRNYYRAGRDFYEKGDYDQAAQALEKAAALDPTGAEAANAKRLLSNIKVVQGKLSLQSREEKALGRQVKKELAGLNVELEERQRQALARGEQAAREGRGGEAKVQFEAARSLGEQLVRQGAEAGEQDARLRGVAKQLSQIRKQEQERANVLSSRYRALKGSGRYGEALEIGRTLQRLDSGPQKVPQLQQELEELAVKAVRAGKDKAIGDRLASSSRTEPMKNALIVTARPEDREKVNEMARALDSESARRPAAEPDTIDALAWRMEEGKPVSGKRGAAPAKTSRVYDVRDLVTRTDERADVNADIDGDGGLLGSLRQTVGSGSTVQITKGRLVVTGGQREHELAGELLGKLRSIRGPQVQLGTNITQQRASGLLSLDATDMPADTSGTTDLFFDTRRHDKDGIKALASDSTFDDFLERNYGWQERPRPTMANWHAEAPTTRPAAGAPAIHALTPEDFKAKLAKKLATNLEQTVTVNSINVGLSAASASGLGVSFVRGANGIDYAVVDEAQLRTLRELEARRVAARPTAEPNLRRQDTIVGTDALLASGQIANITFAGDLGNTLDINGNTVPLPHAQYILIDNGGYLTAVQAGQMQHWTQPGQAVQFAEVPQDIDVPRLGRLERFEKTLIEATDSLEIRATYTWEGAER